MQRGVELLEETGYEADHWSLLLGLDLSNSVTDDSALIFLAQGLTEVAQPSLESTESDLVVSSHKLSDLLDLIGKGEITDAITVAALLAYQNQILRA